MQLKHTIEWIIQMTLRNLTRDRQYHTHTNSAGVAHETCRNPTWADLIHPYISIWRLKNFFKSSLYRVTKIRRRYVVKHFNTKLIRYLFRYSLYMFWERSSSLLQQSQSHTELLYYLQILRCVLFKLLLFW